MNPTRFFVFVGIPATAGALLWERHRQQNAEALTRGWALMNSLEVVKCRPCWFIPIRFWLTVSRSQVVLRIVARERDGSERSGLAICGGYFVGLFRSSRQQCTERM